MSTLCRVYGYLYNAQGQVVTQGTITLRLQQDIVSVDGTKVAPFEVSHDLGVNPAGFFEKYLYATVGASPGGLAYLVEYDPDPTNTSKPASQKDGYWRNHWAVPNAASAPIGNFVSANRGEPFTNYMPLSGQLVNPELPDAISLGLTPSASNKTITASQAASNNPTLRYNGGSAYWDLSDDGTTYRRIITGAGTIGKLTKWSAAGVLADSIVSESGSILTVVDTINVSTLTTPTSTDLNLNPTGNIKASKDVVPDTALTRKIGSSTLKYSSLYAGELFVDTLVAQSSLATVGGRVIVAPTTSLTANLGSGATLGFLKHNQPTKDDILFMEDSGLSEYLQIDSWPIVAVNTTSEWFEVAGDFTTTFTNGRTFVVRASTGNNGTWTVSSAAYQAGTVRTRITVTGNVTNATADGHVAYLDSGPFLYRLIRNLEGGSDAWSAGDALMNTGTPSTGVGFIDMYSMAGILTGTGPAIVGNIRTGATYNQIEPRWAIGNLNGLYGYVTTEYGAAFGVATGAWVKIDPTNGVRLGYNTTTKIQISAAGTVFTEPNITLGTTTFFDSAGALKFVRPASGGFGQTGDLFSVYSIVSAPNHSLFLDNTIKGLAVGSGGSSATALVVLNASGWNNASAGSSVTPVSITLQSGVSVPNSCAITAALTTVSSEFRVFGSTLLTAAVNLSGRVNPAQITSNQNNYNPTGLSTTFKLHILSDAARDITGLTAQDDGRVKWIWNYGGFNITLKHQNASSTAANRFFCPNAADVVLRPFGNILVQYDSAANGTGGWVVLGA